MITWLAAIWLAWRFTWVIEPLLGDWVVAPDLKIWAARILVFVLVMVAGGLTAWLVRELIRRTSLGSTDRMLGSIFGLGRGVLIVGLAVIFLQFTGLDQNPWWQNARFSSSGEQVADGIRYYVDMGSAAISGIGEE